MRELSDEKDRLWAKSILTEKEADVYAKLWAFADYHQTPSLAKYINSQLKYKMSINGRGRDDHAAPFKRAEENSQKKSLKQTLIDLG